MINRRQLITSGILLLILIGLALAGITWFNNRSREVTITVSEPTTAINIYRLADPEAHDISVDNSSIETTVSSTKVVKLRPGSYQAAVADTKNFEATTVDFNIPNTASITVQPVFSASRLSSLLKNQRSTIERAVATKLKQSSHRVSEVKLYQNGDWAGVILVPSQTTNPNRLDWQHVVLKKSQGRWQVLTEPAITLDAKTYPKIPVSVLKDLNQQQYDPVKSRGYRE